MLTSITNQAAKLKNAHPLSRANEGYPPSIFGTGLVALDIIFNASPAREAALAAGGTCANVLTILSYLGWDAFPITRLDADAASKIVRADLTRWGVSLDFSSMMPSAGTPIIVETLHQTKTGVPKHRFSFTCPICGAWFPSFRPVTIEAAAEVADAVAGAVPSGFSPRVFFFDRASRSALHLAQSFAAQGALIVFEPSGIGDPKLFSEAVAVTHVLKYSRERMPKLAERQPLAQRLLLEVETSGSDGLRYRSRRLPTSSWQSFEAIRAPALVDTVGAGDWCTAGILARLATNGVAGFEEARPTEIAEALRFGQAAAAIACGYEGARGAMYVHSRAEFMDYVSLILEKKPKTSKNNQFKVAMNGPPKKDQTPLRIPVESVSDVCPACL